MISLIGTRVYIFQSVKHFCCTLTLASWVLSQADLFLPRLTISPHPTLFFFKSCCPYHSFLSSRLFFLSLCWGCLFSLSIDLYSSTCLLLRGPLCSSAALLIPFANANSRNPPCLAGFYISCLRFLFCASSTLNQFLSSEKVKIECMCRWSSTGVFSSQTSIKSGGGDQKASK